MSNDETNKNTPDLSGAKKKRRSRVREIDFMRVEGSLHDDPLHPFELEVKQKLADSSSPLDELLEKEKHAEERKILRKARSKLTWLLKSNVLTSKQKEYFRLLYVQKRADKDLATRLGVSRSTIRRMRQDIQIALHKALAWKNECHRVRKRKEISTLQLTAKQRVVFRLRYKEGLSVSEIARKLGKSRKAIYSVLARVTKLFF